MKVTTTRLCVLGAGTAAGILIGKALFVKQQVWEVTYGRRRDGASGFGVRLSRAPAWAILLEDALEPLPCVHPSREWTWKYGIGRSDDGEPRYTAGEILTRLCDARHIFARAHISDAQSLPISVEVAERLSPAWVSQCREMFDD